MNRGEIDAPAATGRSWVIGAAAECDLVIEEPTVSGRHCRLTQTRRGFVLEDLGSTNGTFVNGLRLQRPRRVARIDRITLGQTVPMPWPKAEADADVPVFEPDTTTSRRLLVAAAAGAGLLLVLALAVWGVMAARRPAGQSSRDEGTIAALPETKKQSAQSEAVNGSDSKSEQQSAAVDPAEAVYSVLVSDDGGQEIYRIGTAWAVGERQLVTSGAVVQAIEKLRPDFPKARVSCPATQREYDVVNTRMHPEFQSAYREAAAAQEESDRLREELQQADDPNSGVTLTDEEVEARVQKLVDAEERRFLATERQTDCDLGVLQIRETLAPALRVSASRQPPAPRSAARAVGLPFGEEETFVDPETDLELSSVSGRIRAVPASDDKQVRLVVAWDADDAVRSWTGSAVLDASERVIGVYSRPAVSSDPNAEPANDAYDAAWIGRLRELAPELVK